jgi:hypothetical protein
VDRRGGRLKAASRPGERPVAHSVARAGSSWHPLPPSDRRSDASIDGRSGNIAKVEACRAV